MSKPWKFVAIDPETKRCIKKRQTEPKAMVGWFEGERQYAVQLGPNPDQPHKPYWIPVKYAESVPADDCQFVGYDEGRFMPNKTCGQWVFYARYEKLPEEQLKQAVKDEAARRIEENAPLWRQINELTDGSETKLRDYVRKIRAASDRLERNTPPDFRDDRYWK